jgi:mono/diheme cytochrome c family protein
MTRIVANVILIFAVFFFAAISPLWQIPVAVNGNSLSGLKSELANDDTDSPASPVPLEWGRDIYVNACAGCHGSGKNDLGIGEPHFRPLGDRSPRDIYRLITWGQFEKMSEESDSGNSMTDSKPHPLFSGTLVETELWAVSVFLCSSANDSPEVEKSEWKKVWYNKINKPDSGESPPRKFSSLCAQCHGSSGLGNGPLASDLIPHPCDLRDPTWLAGQSFNGLTRTIRAGKLALASGSVSDKGVDESWSGMPAFRELLDDNQINELADYIFSWGYNFSVPGLMPSLETAQALGMGGMIVPSSNEWANWNEIKSKLADAPDNQPAWMMVLQNMEGDD